MGAGEFKWHIPLSVLTSTKESHQLTLHISLSTGDSASVTSRPGSRSGITPSTAFLPLPLMRLTRIFLTRDGLTGADKPCPAAVHPAAESPAVTGVDGRRALARLPADSTWMRAWVPTRKPPELPVSAYIAAIIPDEAPGDILDRPQGIIGDDQDDAQGWMAILACGPRQHRHHQPPWTNRPWVTTAGGRESRLGARLDGPCATVTHPLPARVPRHRRAGCSPRHRARTVCSPQRSGLGGARRARGVSRPPRLRGAARHRRLHTAVAEDASHPLARACTG
jgi:hypothetical protein